MLGEVFYIILEDAVLLSKKEYSDWRDIQNEYYDSYIASLGPWTYQELISYFEDDFKNEDNWPFKKEILIDFFEGCKLVLYAD